jgi:hypothetical protein
LDSGSWRSRLWRKVGIPLAGLGYAKAVNELESQKFTPNAQRCWVERDTPLFTYRFVFYRNEKPNKLVAFFSDEPKWHQEFTITSPISGMLLGTREEETIGFIPSGLQYQFCKDHLLTALLVPNDESSPDTSNFYTYDQISRLLAENMDLLPFRDHSQTATERLREWMARQETSTVQSFEKDRTALRSRDRNKCRSFGTREISTQDYELIRNVQHLRSGDLSLRDKLVHIARKHAESA